MIEEPTITAAIQRYLDALPRDSGAEPIVRELMERSVCRLRMPCDSLLHRSYPRLTQPPLIFETNGMLGGLVAELLTAMRTVPP